MTALTAFGVWIVLTFATKYVSVGSIGACITLIVLSVLRALHAPFPCYDDLTLKLMPPEHALPLAITTIVIALFIIIKHKGNIKRLMNGTENGFGSKRKTPKA